MQEITSRDNERVKYACKVASSSAWRAETGLFFAEGRRLCLDLAQRQKPHTVFLTQEALDACPQAANLADETFLVRDSVAQKLGETQTSQGLYCLFERPAAGFEALRPADGLLLCEQLQDPTNVGAVLRSAAAFGYGGVVLSAGSADAFSPRSVRASAGAVLRVPILAGVEAVGTAARLREEGVALYAAARWIEARQTDGHRQFESGGGSSACGGTEGDGTDVVRAAALPPEELAPRGSFALLVGNEGAGLSQALLALAHGAVAIPMQGGVESLNAAVAASVLMYALRHSGGVQIAKNDGIEA